MDIAGLEETTRILRGAVLGPRELAAALGFDPLATLGRDAVAQIARVPFTTAELERARAEEALLVLRIPRAPEGPLTMLGLASRLTGGLAEGVHKGVGYLLRDEWTIDGQPFAEREECAPGWWLVRRSPWPETFNQSYGGQEETLARLGPPDPDRPLRRSAVEIAYDTLLWERVHGERLLGAAWDWSRSLSTDNGYVALGEFGPAGLHVVAYSRAVRFGTLGVCPQR